jgi:hypothetical protein
MAKKPYVPFKGSDAEKKYGTYENYLKAINTAYIDRLRASGDRTTPGYTVGGKDYGYGPTAPPAFVSPAGVRTAAVTAQEAANKATPGIRVPGPMVGQGPTKTADVAARASQLVTNRDAAQTRAAPLGVAGELKAKESDTWTQEQSVYNAMFKEGDKVYVTPTGHYVRDAKTFVQEEETPKGTSRREAQYIPTYTNNSPLFKTSNGFTISPEPNSVGSLDQVLIHQGSFLTRKELDTKIAKEAELQRLGLVDGEDTVTVKTHHADPLPGRDQAGSGEPVRYDDL